MMKDRKRQVRSKPGGATSRRPAGPSLLQRLRALMPVLVRRVFAVLVLGGLATGSVLLFIHGKDVVAQASARPINSIGVQGHFVNVSREEISERVEPMIVGGFLQSPLSAIKRELELHPWVAQATVSRRWPDELYISIVEEQAIARWGEVGFLNHRGDLIKVAQSSRLNALPLLSGQSGQEQSVMQHYQQLAQMFRPHGLRIRELHSNNLMSRRLVLDKGVIIQLGRDQTLEKIQRFLVVYNQELQERMSEIVSIDLRYGNGLAVQWKAQDEESFGEEAMAAGCCSGKQEIEMAFAAINNQP